VTLWRRPKMIAEFNKNTFPGDFNAKLDQFDLNAVLSSDAEIVHLGDVFMKGYSPPDFVGTIMVLDKQKQQCPSGTNILGMPCFVRPDSADVDPTKQ
jgi:hypothetical protein